jgi:hypothetical protein
VNSGERYKSTLFGLPISMLDQTTTCIAKHVKRTNGLQASNTPRDSKENRHPYRSTSSSFEIVKIKLVDHARGRDNRVDGLLTFHGKSPYPTRCFAKFSATHNQFPHDGNYRPTFEAMSRIYNDYMFKEAIQGRTRHCPKCSNNIKQIQQKQPEYSKFDRATGIPHLTLGAANTVGQGNSL